MTWQPIETAPRDGTRLLIYLGGWIEGWWESGYGEWEVIRCASHGCGCCSFANEEPTGWMPLPERPE